MTSFEILVEYFRSLCNSHNLVKTFKTCESYEENENHSDYPQILFLNPFTTSFKKTNTNSIDVKNVSVTFTLVCLSNFIVDENGNIQTVTESTLSNVDNQINEIGIIQKDQLINIPYKIIIEFCTKFINDLKNPTSSIFSKIVIDSIDIENDERITVDDVYLSKAVITVSMQNLLNCGIEAAFQKI